MSTAVTSKTKPRIKIHPLEDRLLVLVVEVLDQRDRVVGVELAGDIGDLLRFHRIEQVFADVIVQLGKHVGTDDPGQRLDQALTLVTRSGLDQVGDVGGMERRDQFAGRIVVPGLDCVEHLVDEFRAEPVFAVDDLGFPPRIDRASGGDWIALRHVAPLD